MHEGTTQTLSRSAEVGDGTRLSVAAYRVLVVASAGLLALGALLTPAEKGFGTHEQLGLPPCAFPILTGYPCPTCGVTTAVAHMCRLQFGAALAAQPFGALVAAGASAFLIWTAAALLVGRSPLLALAVFRSWWFRGFVIAAYFGSWFFKVAAVACGWQEMAR